MALQEPHGKGERILLVEDEELIRALASAMLRQYGCYVFEAESAEEALDIFEREDGDFHLVFTDVVLPGRDGLSLAEQLLSRNPKLSILLSSGGVGNASRWSRIREKGYAFLQKPYRLEDLLPAVRGAMEPRPHGTAAIQLTQPL